ncbi:MAG: hypothetical protein H6620_09740 [Halobacteriovoraceae bacterium]|nr:hypothetical protein [Halobacteriovoraceae bacterium]
MSVTFRTECEAVGEKMLQLYASTIEEIKDNARQIEYIASSSDLVELKKKGYQLFLDKVNNEFTTKSANELAKIMIAKFKVQILGSKEVDEEIRSCLKRHAERN